jgi:hypothetical protein
MEKSLVLVINSDPFFSDYLMEFLRDFSSPSNQFPLNFRPSLSIKTPAPCLTPFLYPPIYLLLSGQMNSP